MAYEGNLVGLRYVCVAFSAQTVGGDVIRETPVSMLCNVLSLSYCKSSLALNIHHSEKYDQLFSTMASVCRVINSLTITHSLLSSLLLFHSASTARSIIILVARECLIPHHDVEHIILFYAGPYV